MAQVHFVAIGGTGQHVALSYVDVAVLSEWLVPFEPSRLWLFDADAMASTGSRSAWDEACDQVRFLRRSSRPGDQHWADPLANHHRPYLESTDAALFQDAICPDLGPIFFDDEQQQVSFRNGYYGEAAVAATVFGALLESPEQSQQFADLLNAPKVGDARVVVAGSAVGGTGSGCLPRLVEALDNASGGSANGRLMALLYLPWFRLEGGEGRSAKRNDEMAARTAAGLFYYNNRLRIHSAAVVMGHPDIAAARTPRPWQGDTQQERHGDLSLPLYGACVATQFVSAERALPFGLYSVASAEPGRQLFSSAVPVGRFADTSALWTLSKLADANRELCRRLHWTARYVETLGQRRPLTFGHRFAIPGLAGASVDIAATLDEWVDTKLASLHRIQATLDGEAAIQESSPKTRPSFKAPERGLETLREWVPTTAGGSPEAIVRAIAETLTTGRPWSDHAPLETSSERLLPPRTAAAIVQVQPRKVAVGTATMMDTNEADALIKHEKVTARALPSSEARGIVLAGALQGRLGQTDSLDLILSKVLDAGFTFSDTSSTEALIQKWFLILLGFAADRIEVGTTAQQAARERPIALATKSRPGSAGRLADARLLTWATTNDGRIVIGYSDPEVGFVPAAQNRNTWERVLQDLRLPLRRGLADAVAAWSTMLIRAAEAACAECPEWLARLGNEWGQAQLTSTTSFGLSDKSIDVAWSGDSTIPLRFPVADRKADASWTELFVAMGLEVQKACPAGDKQAQAIHSLLQDDERCPRFLYMREDGASEVRIALWLLPAGHPDCGLHSQAARFIHDRYFISVQAGVVWDVRVDGQPVQVVDRSQILLNNVGYLLDGLVERIVDYPVRWEYLDLVDLHQSSTPPRLDGSKVTFRLQLRGYPEPTEHVAKKDDALLLPAGVLLWPNFTAPGWTQRYIWVRQRGKVQLACRIASSDRPTGTLSSAMEVELSPRPNPVAFQMTGSSHIPRALSLRAKDRAYGAFRLELRHLQRTGRDSWGIDFGTSGSVVAAVKDGNDWTQAKLLSPGPKSDCTHTVLLGEPVRLERLMWFPSWDGLAPRKDTSAVLPTRIVVDHKVPKPDQVLNDEGEYGRRWLLDHGGPLDPMVQKSYRVLHQLKWGRHVGPRRRAYLLRLLEQAAAWRAQTTPSGANKEALPNEVTAVFTVPLRMRDEVRAFETDVKHVVTDLKRLTGISLQPLFQWESNAGAVPSRARRPERVYATIDLGGGSLDFWGCYFDNNGVAHQHADSLRLGGGALIRALAQDGNAAYIDEALRKLGPEEAPSDVLSEIAGYSEKVSFFFETVREVCARWLAALSKEAEANGSPAEEFNVGMLGRAWFMGGPDWRGSVRALRLIQTRMKELGCERPLVRHRDVPEGQTDRKTYLARYVAGFSRDAEKSMTSILDEQNGFVGTNLDHEVGHGRQEVIKWFTPLPIPSPDDSKFYLGRTSADRDRLHPSLPRALAEAVPKYENTILDRINRKGGDQGGYRDSHGVHLTRSPFHSLIELAMDGWAGDES